MIRLRWNATAPSGGVVKGMRQAGAKESEAVIVCCRDAGLVGRELVLWAVSEDKVGKVAEGGLTKWLGEEISLLQRRGDVDGRENALLVQLADVVIAHVDVFAHAAVALLDDEGLCSSVVAQQRRRTFLR